MSLSKSRAWFPPFALLLVVFALPLPAFADYTASGKFLYEDRQFSTSGFTGSIDFRPIRFAEVRIVADASGAILATGSTNASGDFTITVPGSTSQLIKAVCVTASHSTSGFKLKVLAANANLTTNTNPYSISSTAIPATGSGTVAIGTLLATAVSDAGRAFNIWDVAVDGMEFATAATGSFPTLGMTMLWSRSHRLSGGGSFAICTDPPAAYIDTGSAQDDPVIAHRFGQFLLNAYSKEDEPCPEKLPHFVLGDGDQDVRLAWSEGAGMYLGAMIRKSKGYPRPDFYFFSTTNGSAFAFSTEIESLSSQYLLASREGSTNMLAVAAALWDITDGTGPEDSTPGTDDDPLARPFSDVWRVITTYLSGVSNNITVERFWDGWNTLGIGSASEMGTIFVTLNGIQTAADPQEADNSTGTAPLVPSAVLSLAGGSRVLINEVDAGVSTNSIELFNAGDLEADLTGWTVVASRAGAVAVRIEIPSFKLQRGNFVRLVIGSGADSPSGAGKYTIFSRISDPVPWRPGMDGACALRDRSGTPRDFVRWGDSSEFPVGEWKGSNPASPSFGRTLGRNYTGTDTDSGSDWSAQEPSPGTFNLGGPEKHHTFYPAGDVDYIGFDATAGRTYVLEALNLGNGADTLLQLLGTDGTTVLATSDDVGAGRGSRIGWSAPAGGRYFVAVRRYDGQLNPAEYGSYDLRVIESAVAIPVAGAETRTVSKSGGGGMYEVVSDAVADAGNGDTIQIMDSGTYTESISITGKTVTLKTAPGQHPVLDGRQISGPTITLSRNKSVRVDGLTILGNSKGIQVTGGPAVIVNTTVARATGQSGDGIAVVGADASAAIVNCTAYGNSQGGIVAYNSANIRVSNSIAYGNNVVDIGRDASTAEGNVTVRNSVVAKGTYSGKDGNINSDPQFVNAGSNDFHLQGSSPCIDKGDGSDRDLPATDAEGYPRTLDGDGNGSAIPDMGAFEYVSAASLTSASVFPQIAAGGNYRTTMFGVNTNTQSAIVNLSLTKSDASSFVVTIGGKTSSLFSMLLPPGGTTRLEASSSSGLAAGYAKFVSNVRVNGSALFQTLNGANVVSEAGVGLSKPTRSFTVYIDNTNDAYSGYAVANTGTSPASLTLTLRDQQGAVVTTRSRTLGPGEHFARFAADQAEFGSSAPAGFEGSIEVTSDREVEAVALRYDNPTQDVFSTIPVLVDEAAATLYFPQAADGGGYRTNFILVNPNNVDTTATLEFFRGDGNPLTLPIGGTMRTTYQVPLKSKGVVRFLTDGTSPGVAVGWVRVTSPQPLGGSAIFQTLAGTAITSEAGVSSSPRASRFTTYVESVGFTESGLAICNPNPEAVGITLNLRDHMGNLVESLSTSLPRLGHVAKFFSERDWFGGAYSEFQGTLEVVATAPVSAVALRYDNQGPQVFATLPVIVIP